MIKLISRKLTIHSLGVAKKILSQLIANNTAYKDDYIWMRENLYAFVRDEYRSEFPYKHSISYLYLTSEVMILIAWRMRQLESGKDMTIESGKEIAEMLALYKVKYHRQLFSKRNAPNFMSCITNYINPNQLRASLIHHEGQKRILGQLFSFRTTAEPMEFWNILNYMIDEMVPINIIEEYILTYKQQNN